VSAGGAETPSTLRASGPREKGLWADLDARLKAPSQRSGLYAALAREPSGSTAAAGVWSTLTQRADLARYQPRRAAGVVAETLVEDGQSFTVLRGSTGRYVRLTPPEAALWAMMDGSVTVERLATHGFLQFRQLLPVSGLVASLRAAGCLEEPPVGLYAALGARLQDRTVEGWGRRVLRGLRQREFAIDGVDAAAGAVHRAGGRLLFTRPALLLLGLLILVGLGCFAWLGLGGAPYRLIDPANSLAGLLGLWAALLVSFVLHELAHALAVKQFGRTVLRGGVMIYFGMPAAFVDTSDIWLAGRRARILTSLAGPVCDLVVGSVAAVVAAIAGGGAVGAAAYTLAVAAYLAALCNLNPLLELDGYYMLSDWLGLPNLRRRAFAFISGPLWQKLRTGAALGREERIFAIYGAFAAAYTLLAVALALLFWQTQLAGMLGGLWASGGLLERALAVLLLLAVVVPLGLGLIVGAWGLVRGAARWAARRGYGRRAALVAGAFALLALALAGLPLRFPGAPALGLLPPLLWLVALVAQLALRADYRGAAVARALDCFLAVTVIEGVALLGFALLPAWGEIWSACENVGFALLLLAGFIALLDADLRQSTAAELAGSALLMVLAFLAAGLSIGLLQADRPGLPFLRHVLAAAPVYSSAVALALLLPLVAGLRDSRLIWSWLLLWLGIAAQTGAYLLELLDSWQGAPATAALAVLASGLWAAAWCSHAVALRQPQPRDLRWPLEPAAGEAERLQRAFRHVYAGLYRGLRAHQGARRARALDDRMDVLAATANWTITLDRDQARIGAELAAAPLDAQGARYAEVLRYTVDTVEELAGATFARRAVQAAYDALPWPEREAADRRCFPNTPWARALSRSFGDARAARLRLLRQVERFAACDDAELLAVAEAMEPRRAAPGALLLQQGEQPPGLWVVEAGEVAARAGGAVVAELHRGACFGAQGAGPDDPPAAHSYRASVESALLFVAGAQLRRLLAGAAPHLADGQAAAETVRLLERAPLFQRLSRRELRALARHAHRQVAPPRSVVVRQGHPSARLYLILRGEAAVVQQRRDDAQPAATPGAQLLARLGPDELFGEQELLRPGPLRASLVAVSELELLAIDHGAVAALIHGGAARTT
jgi:putative peptide zinc metalloprotease protein